jgi:hypothetical protein
LITSHVVELAIAVTAAGCFSPTPQGNLPCPDNWCPPPQRCVNGFCTGANDAGPSSPPTVTATPGPAPLLDSNFQWCDAYPGPFGPTLVADQSSATIYYTTDGTMPDAQSMHAASPVALPGGTTDFVLAYFALSNAGASPIAMDAYAFSDTCKPTWGYLVTNTKLDGTSAVVDATPGQQLHGSASMHTWIQNGCAGCGTQLVYGIGMQNTGCYFATGVTFPGTMGTMTIDLTAPSAAGVYDVNVHYAEDADCPSAVADTSATWSLRKARIGVIVVR